MITKAILTDLETGGGGPIDCEVTKRKHLLRIEYGGCRGWALSINLDDVIKAIDEGLEKDHEIKNE